MRLFGGRRAHSRLEQRLTDERPEPRSQLIDDLTTRSKADTAPVRRRLAGQRLGLGVALCLVLVGALASVGALSPAQESALNAATATADAAVQIVSQPTSVSDATVPTSSLAGSSTAITNGQSSSSGGTGSAQSSGVQGSAAGPQQSAKFSTRFLATIGTYVSNSWICHWAGGTYDSTSAGVAGNWAPVQITTLVIYNLHTGHTFDIGPNPSFTTDTACAAAATANSPTVTINQAAGQVDPTSVSPINFTVVFNQSVSDFATGDVSLSGTAGATTGAVTGSGTTYNVAVSGMTSFGTVIATIGAGVAHNTAGYGNYASTSSDNSVSLQIAITSCNTGLTGKSNNVIGTTPINTGTVIVNFYAGTGTGGTLVLTKTVSPSGGNWNADSGQNVLTGGATYTAQATQTTSTSSVSNQPICTFAAR